MNDTTSPEQVELLRKRTSLVSDRKALRVLSIALM